METENRIVSNGIELFHFSKVVSKGLGGSAETKNKVVSN
jgi:hypothetical protein